MTPNELLHRSVLLGDLLGGSVAVANKADPDDRDDRGRTPLMIACWLSNKEFVGLLLGAGADVNAVNDSGTTPFMYAKSAAMGGGKTDILQMLIDHGADINALDSAGLSALHYARENSAKIIDYIVAKGGK